MSNAKLKFEDVDDNEIESKKERESVKENIPAGFYEITGVPSKMKLYPEGTKIYSRPLKILEIKQLSSMNDMNYNSIMNSVLKKTVKGIDVDDLVIADKLFIIFWQRANTYKGDGFSVPFACDKCGEDSQYDFGISNIEMEDIKDEYDPNYELVLPESGTKIKLSQMRVRDERLVERFMQQNRSEELDEDLLTIAALITSMNGKDNTLRNKYEFLTEKLSVRDNLELGKHYKKYEISIKPLLKVTCKQCGGQATTPITFRRDFFLPNYSA